MEPRPLGRTGLTVSPVGLGAGRIGGPEMADAEVDRLVGAACDLGVTLFDSARSYGLSEERLGRVLGGRREAVVLSTKVGYGVEGIPDWTGPCITEGIEGALRRMRTDRLDIVHLHSCGREVLERGEVVEALGRAVEAGKVRVAAYSGEGEALRWAVESKAFGAVQCSVSIVDQGVLAGAVPMAAGRNLGVLAKRPLGNAPWRFGTRPQQPDVAEAWDRFRTLALESPASGWTPLFARFAAFAPGVSSILAGTASIAHLAETIDAVALGPLEAGLTAELRSAFSRLGAGWDGRV